MERGQDGTGAQSSRYKCGQKVCRRGWGGVSEANEQIRAFVHEYVQSFPNKYECLSSKNLEIWQRGG